MNIKEVEDKIRACVKSYGDVQSPRISTLAKFINLSFPELEAIIETTSVTKDSDVPGTRLRRPGKTYDGYLLKIYERGKDKQKRGGLRGFVDAAIFTHNTAETYRHNGEVCKWIVNYMEENDNP